MRTKCRDKPESLLRDDLEKKMRPYWHMTWHEDREVNPGVPDVSYVMAGGEHETGWLELKACRPGKNGKYEFKLEQSQHQWMRTHALIIPVHFYLRVEGVRDYVLSGTQHHMLAVPTSHDELIKLGAVAVDPLFMASHLSLFLRKVTFRRRHEGFLREVEARLDDQGGTGSDS